MVSGERPFASAFATRCVLGDASIPMFHRMSWMRVARLGLAGAPRSSMSPS